MPEAATAIGSSKSLRKHKRKIWRQDAHRRNCNSSVESQNMSRTFSSVTCCSVTRTCCSVTKSCQTLRDSTDYNMSGFPVLHLHCLWEFAQNHIHWVGDAISTSVTPLSSCPQSFLASWSFPMSQFFTSGGQSSGASASALDLPMNIQGWFHLGCTGLISLLSKGLSRVFSSITVQKHQFFSTHRFSPQIHRWLLEKP